MAFNTLSIHDIKDIKGFRFKPQVASLMRKKEPLPEDIVKTAKMIHAAYRQADRVEALKTYLALTLAIDETKRETIGLNAPATYSNMLSTYLASCFANEIMPDQKFIDSIADFEKRMALEIKPGVNLEYVRGGWFIPKTILFRAACQTKLAAIEVADLISIQAPSLAVEGLLKAFSNPAEINSQIFSEIRAMQKYGVKTVVFRDGLLNVAGFDWIFSETMFKPTGDRMTDFSARAHFRDVQACISLVKRGVKPSELFNVNNLKYSARSQLNFTSIDGLMTAYIGSDGEIGLSAGPGVSPLRDIFAAQGRGELYDYFHFVQLMRLFDLVVPVVQVAKMPVLPSEPSAVGKILQASGISKKPRDYIDILLPRVRLLESHSPDVLADLIKEVEVSETETIKRVHKPHAEHTVIGFVRPLPQGYKPSKRARELAFENLNGYVLQDNETYVKTHKSGKGPAKDAFHKARR
ncbi:MAG: hypothetical protein WC506_06830 [Candidatus Micrarchaeia archaeon]